MANFSEMGIQVVESEENEEGEAPAAKAEKAEEAEEEEQTGNVDEASLGRTDDPVRMYLREMGSVELLSREGEIAIAKRIEAGRDMMINGLCESPLTFKAIITWHEQLKAGRMLLRDIVDLEATDGAGAPAAGRRRARRRRAPADGFAANDDMDGDDEDGGPSMSLSALEEKLKPEVLANFEEIENLYKKLHKMQHRRLETITSGEEMSSRSEKGYEKIREELVEKVGQVRLHNNRIEELVSQLKLLNQRLTTLEGQLMRMAESCKVNREEFLKHYRGAELDPNWLDRVGRLTGKGWKVFVIKHPTDIGKIRGADLRRGDRCQPADRRVPPRLHDRFARRAGQRPGEEGDDRGEPAPGDLDREEIHQSRAAVPGSDPGRQHRPDEGGGQVRVPPRLQVQHLCDVVDPAGDHPLHRRSGAHDPHSGAHDRDDQQAGAHLPPDAARNRPRAGAGGTGRQAGHAAGESPQSAEDRQGADQPGDADRRRGRFASRRLHRGQGGGHPAGCGDPGESARGHDPGAVVA